MKTYTIFIMAISVVVGTLAILSSECSPLQAGDSTDPFATWRNAKDYKDIVKVTEGVAISSEDDLKKIQTTGTYYLTQDINLNGKWKELHSKENPFTGTLYGNGYVINNLEIDNAASSYIGLFSSLKGAKITNLGIGVKKIVGQAVIGALAGYAEGIVVTNIAVAPVSQDVKIQAVTAVKIAEDGVTGFFVGGIVGYLAANEKTISEMKSVYNLALEVNGTGGDYVGGLVGSNVHTSSDLKNCFSTGTVIGNNYVGGLVGSNEGILSGSVLGAVSGTNSVGGLVGENNNGTVSGYSSGKVSGNNRVGGLIGNSNSDKPVKGHAIGTVSGQDSVGGLVGIITLGELNGYVTGSVSGISHVGGLVGRNEGATINGYVTSSVSGTSHVGGLVGLNNSTTVGYVRGIVKRLDGVATSFGVVIGTAGAGIATAIFSSGATGEGQVLQADGNALTDAVGLAGTKVTVDAATTKNSFPGFVFDNGPWKWIADGKWPAINIDIDIIDKASQPINP